MVELLTLKDLQENFTEETKVKVVVDIGFLKEYDGLFVPHLKTVLFTIPADYKILGFKLTNGNK